jgi:hypothetical protein
MTRKLTVVAFELFHFFSFKEKQSKQFLKIAKCKTKIIEDVISI